MHAIRIPPAYEIPRITKFDLEETIRSYKAWLLRGAFSWGYAPSRSALSHALQHTASLEWLLRQCDLTQPPSGREPNKQVIRGIWRLGSEYSWKVYDAPDWYLDFRPRLATRIPADCLIVENDRPHLFWLQMRTGGAAPNEKQLALCVRMALRRAELGGHPELGMIIADMRNSDGNTREALVRKAEDFSLPSIDELEATLQIFADAHARLVEEGFDPKAVIAARKGRRRQDSPQADLFS